MAGELDGYYAYVLHWLVPTFEELGWSVITTALPGTHHGQYSDLMRWTGAGEPIYPPDWRKSA